MLMFSSPTATRTFLSFSPLQRDVIKVIAFLAMVADHIATAIGVGSPWFNLVGRCAFSLFALVSGCNLAGKTVQQGHLNRLWVMALLAGFQGGRRSVVATEYIVHLCGGDAGGSFPASPLLRNARHSQLWWGICPSVQPVTASLACLCSGGRAADLAGSGVFAACDIGHLAAAGCTDKRA